MVLPHMHIHTLSYSGAVRCDSGVLRWSDGSTNAHPHTYCRYSGVHYHLTYSRQLHEACLLSEQRW